MIYLKNKNDNKSLEENFHQKEINSERKADLNGKIISTYVRPIIPFETIFKDIIGKLELVPKYETVLEGVLSHSSTKYLYHISI